MRKHYAVRRGRKRGIFTSWPETQELVTHYPRAEYQSFATRAEAEAYLGDFADAYIEVHVDGQQVVAPLTDEIRTALVSAGVDLLS